MASIGQDLESLSASDFDTPKGLIALERICARLESEPSPQIHFSHVFSFMERMSEVELGVPGPLVHALEALGGYEASLFESVARKPTAYTIWMLNRILNSLRAEADRRLYLTAIEASLVHPAASASAREAAALFLE